MTNASAISVGGDIRTAESARSIARLSSLSHAQRQSWTSLSESACEPNVFFHPAFALAALRLKGQRGKRALIAYAADGARMTGFLPVDSGWRALRTPVPVLVAPQTYTSLATPLLATGDELTAASDLIDAAAEAGARVLVLPRAALNGRSVEALRQAATKKGLRFLVEHAHERAILTASGDAEARLREGLGAKKLKELRRQRRRLEDLGPIDLVMAEAPGDVASAVERFLALEAAGWKGRRGTALGQRADNAEFLSALGAGFSAHGAFTVAEMTLNGRPIASGVVMRAASRAFLFKITYDENFARYSPGVQLILDLTRHFIGDSRVSSVDSIADANHPMIDHVWRERMPVGDVYISTAAGDRLAPALIALLTTRARVRSYLKSAYHFFRKFSERLYGRHSSF